MSTGGNRRALHQLIEDEREAYLDALSPPDPDWPSDVRAMLEDIHAHLFDPGLRVKHVRERCGIGNNNVSSRFRLFVGRAPKDYILYHRMELAKRLLQDRNVQVVQVAFVIGYENASAFSQAFKKKVGCKPSVYHE